MNFTRHLFVKLPSFCLTKSAPLKWDPVYRRISTKFLPLKHSVERVPLSRTCPCIRSVSNSTKLFTENIKVIQKKRPLRKRYTEEEDLKAAGYFQVRAFATADEYDLEAMLAAIEEQDLYAAKKFFSTDTLSAVQDVLYVTAKYKVGEEPRDIFFFRDGSVVLWNCNDLESKNVLKFIKPYETDSYEAPIIHGESEIMPYNYVVEAEGAKFQAGRFLITKDEENYLEKYTFSNALATSIKLGVCEAILDRYIDSMEFVTEDLKRGSKIRISRGKLLRKTGELFALRHQINLSSDLLDTPDFYWDREELEALYSQVCAYFSISRRTKVMNEKLNHCVELAELVSHELNDAHHIRLEWMIIILIMVEVCFEIIHYAERYWPGSSEAEEREGKAIAH